MIIIYTHFYADPYGTETEEDMKIMRNESNKEIFSKIMEKKFLDGIKNQQRKISLLKAMARYNRFKFRGKFNVGMINDKIGKEDMKFQERMDSLKDHGII